ncbi:MAG TPA: oligopeptide/dipeptide ABC transporter ATP-binding protein, partial [Tepidisphaeraceae bacterium]|jgi:oligopeptide/dipeptide ABC transporter ATP-binding protein
LKLQNDTGMAILMITHDLGVVAENADTVAVMYASRVVETASVEAIFDNPQHPYTQGLLRSIPKLGGNVQRLETIHGSVPSPTNFPTGCKFHPRCPSMQGDPTCAEIDPALKEVRTGHWAACHHVPQFEQAPITIPRLPGRRPVVQEVVS